MIQSLLAKGENVLLTSNHQTEADPQVFYCNHSNNILFLLYIYPIRKNLLFVYYYNIYNHDYVKLVVLGILIISFI